MAIITFWSNEKRQMGQTLTAAAIATYMGMEHNSKMLLLSTCYGDTALEEAFSIKSKAKKSMFNISNNRNIDLDSGIAGISKLTFANRLEPNLIKDYTKVVYKDRLEVLFAPQRGVDYTKLSQTYKDIILNANQYYEYVFVDLNKGLDNQLSREILEISDVIVITLEQRLSKVQKFMELQDKEPLLKEPNILVVLGKYDKFSKCNIKNVEKYIKPRRNIYAVPYNTLYLEASDDGSVPDLFLKVKLSGQDDKNGVFMNEIKKISEAIIYKIQERQMNM